MMPLIFIIIAACRKSILGLHISRIRIILRHKALQIRVELSGCGTKRVGLQLFGVVCAALMGLDL